MTRIMWDSTGPAEIPRDAEMVAHYVDGRYAWWPSRAMFPRATFVSISAIGARTAQVGDVEVGCIWPPANAVPWVVRARNDGYDPTIYVNELNDWLPVRQAFWAAGVPEPHYWTARYNGVREIPAGAVARQFAHPHDGDGIADRPWETGIHADASVVADYWPGVDTSGPGGGAGAGDDMFEEEDRRRLNQLYDLMIPGGDVVAHILATGQIPPNSGYGYDGLAFRTLDQYRAIATVFEETGLTLGDAVQTLLSAAEKAGVNIDYAKLSEALGKLGLRVPTAQENAAATVAELKKEGN